MMKNFLVVPILLGYGLIANAEIIKIKSGFISAGYTQHLGQTKTYTILGNSQSSNNRDTGSATFNPSPGFTLVSEDCSNRTLTLSTYCYITFQFTPTVAGIYTASIQMPYSENGFPVSGDELLFGVRVEAIDVAEAPRCPVTISGSIIGMDVGSLGENIPVVGAPFDLVYSSEYAIDYPVFSRMTKSDTFGPEMLMPSIQRLFSPTKLRVYGGGSSEAVKVQAVSGGQYRIFSTTSDDVYIFDSSGKHLETRSALTGFLKFTFNYDSFDKLISIVDSFGNTTTFQRSGGVLTGITAPFGQQTSITTNSSGLVSSVTNPNSETYSLTYKSGTELLETFTLPLGQTSTFTYDTSNKLYKDESSAGSFLQFARTLTNAGESVSQSSQMGRSSGFTTTNDFGTHGANTTQPWGESISISDGPTGSSRTDASGTELRSTVNDERVGISKKRVSLIRTTISGISLDMTMAQTISPTTVTDPFTFNSITNQSTTAGNTWQNVYTAATKTFVSTSPAGATNTTVIDSYERPTSRAVGTDTATTYTYNTDGTLAASTQGTKNGLTYSYNSAGYLQSITNALSEVTSFTYDLSGRPVTKTFPDSRVVSYTYDANGNQTGVTPPSKPIHNFTFNAFDMVSAYQPPTLSGVSVVNTSYTYNNDKQLTQITRPTGATLVFNYGSSTSLLNSITTASGDITYTYLNGSSQIQNVVSAPENIKDTFTYYGTKIKSQIQYINSPTNLNGGVTYTFDSQHRIASRTVRGTSSTNTYTTNYTYNTDSQPTAIGSLAMTYTYPSGRLSTTTVDKISDARTYDVYGNLSGYTSTYTPTTGTPVALYSYSLTRDNTSRITSKSETVQGVTDVYDYAYDTAGRLIEVKKNSVITSSYVYDGNGNRTSGKTWGTTFTSTYDNQDRLATYNSRIYSYNANGDISSINWGGGVGTSTFAYDVRGNLNQSVGASGKVYAFQYDTQDRRVNKYEDAAFKYRYIYEPGKSIATSTISGVIQREFIYGTSDYVPDYINVVVGTVAKYRIIKDYLGSVRLVVNAATGVASQRLDYNDLGDTTADTNAGFQPFGFAGGIYDAVLKIVKFGARDYDPRSGRWMTKDPIDFDGGDTNLYGYVMNDPINFVDPEGLFRYTSTAGGPVDAATSAVLTCMDTCTGRDLTITAGREGGHSAGSAHEGGQACDIGKNSNRGLTRATVQRCYNQCANVNSSYAQEESNHFHIQTRPGRGNATGFAPGVH